MTGELETIEDLRKAATSEAASRLLELAETASDKETRKAAKRALYLLSQSGVRPAGKSAASPVPMAPERQPDSIRIYASAYDGEGNRMLAFLQPDRDGGNPTLTRLFLHNSVGVRFFAGERLPRREATERLERLEQELVNGIALAEVEPDYGRWLLHRSREIHRRQGTHTPNGFQTWAEPIGEPKQDYPQTPIYAHLSPEDIQADETVVRGVSEFFALPWFESWFMEAESGMPWVLQLADAIPLSLELTENSKQERSDAVFRQATEALIAPEVRADYVVRLEESADILWRRGEQAAAKQALYHALELASDRPVAEVSLAMELTKRTMGAAYQLMQEPEE